MAFVQSNFAKAQSERTALGTRIGKVEASVAAFQRIPSLVDAHTQQIANLEEVVAQQASLLQAAQTTNEELRAELALSVTRIEAMDERLAAAVAGVQATFDEKLADMQTENHRQLALRDEKIRDLENAVQRLKGLDCESEYGSAVTGISISEYDDSDAPVDGLPDMEEGDFGL